MRRDVYFPQQVGNDRYTVSKQRKFLWHIWYTPLPYLYVEYDRLDREESELLAQLKLVKGAMKQEKSAIDSFVKAADASFKRFSATLSPRKRKRLAMYTYLGSSSNLFEEERKGKRQRGKPSANVYGAADIAPTNKQSNKQRNQNNQNNQNQGNNNN